MKISRPKAERVVWGLERYVTIILFGSLLLGCAGLAEKYISDFYPWEFVAGGLWTSYVNWRRKIHN